MSYENSTHTIEVAISREKLFQHIESFLYAASLIDDDNELIKLEVDNLPEIIPLKMTIRKEIPKEQEVLFTESYG